MYAERTQLRHGTVAELIVPLWVLLTLWYRGLDTTECTLVEILIRISLRNPDEICHLLRRKPATHSG